MTLSQTHHRRVTPSQLALFSRSPVIGAWWEELKAQELFREELPATSSLDQLLFDQGLQHEQVLLDRLEAEGYSIARLQGQQNDADDAAAAATIDAMRSGVAFIHQASLRNGELRGSADLLERIERPSALGNWSYIPIECKLSSHPKPIYVVQACAYCELLEPILGERPEHFKLYLGGSRFAEGEQGYPVARFWSWYEQLRQRYRTFRAGFDPSQEPEDAPGDHGQWEPFIQQRLDQKRDLILVAGMRGSQRDKLRTAGITTIEQLAALSEQQAVPGMNTDVLKRLREQAAIQLETVEGAERPAFRVRPANQQAGGLALLPAPDPGDIWFDMEGFPDPISGEKLEYMFGACYRDEAGELQFKPWWAHTPAQEKQAFDGFIQWVQQRRLQHPNLHVYHYASYEKTALGNLAARHQLHQSLWDQWLREELFVDLYPIVRRGLLLGAPSYSIKKVERLYSGARSEEVESAADSVVQYAEWRKSGQSGRPGRGDGESPLLQDLQDYNQRDCEVTEGLHRFLLNLPEMAGATFRANRWGDSHQQGSEAEASAARDRELEVAARTLLEEIPESIEDPEVAGPRGLSWRGQRLLSLLIDFRGREDRVSWWEFYSRLLDMTPEEREEDSEVIAAARFESSEPVKSSQHHRYRFDASQPLKLASDGRAFSVALVPLEPHAGGFSPRPHLGDPEHGGRAIGFSAELDGDNPGSIVLPIGPTKRAKLEAMGHSGDALPRHADLIPFPFQVRGYLDNLVRIAQAWVFEGQPLPPALVQLLERRPVAGLSELNARIRLRPDTTAAELAGFLEPADGIGLSLQGPPGTGKTTVTGELIARLVGAGQRVAVSSNTNEAICNLLHRTQLCLEERGDQAMVVKAASGSSLTADQQALGGTAAQALLEKPLLALAAPPAVLGGTVFTFVKDTYDAPPEEAPFDWLVIDEAGQVSLSTLLYMSRVARNILLVGDQQQLSQPTRAAHPEDSGLSCLDYVMADHAVVPPDRGVFLATSWRMPPALTFVVSELFYEGQLQAAPANDANRILWSRQPQGLLFEPVDHSGNSTGSNEEVDHIAALVLQLLGQPFRRARNAGGQLVVENGVLSPRDILITAPYNIQVNRLKRRLGEQARIGTVDKFQGQEAPVAIHSLTASDGDAAPRGLGFLLDPNRLNVAISRAQCLSIVVGSPQLATGISRSVAEVHQLSRLCRLIEIGG
jgi:uncharacterized protein